MSGFSRCEHNTIFFWYPGNGFRAPSVDSPEECRQPSTGWIPLITYLSVRHFIPVTFLKQRCFTATHFSLREFVQAKAEKGSLTSLVSYKCMHQQTQAICFGNLLSHFTPAYPLGHTQMNCVWFANTTASSKDPSLFVASTHVPPFTQGLDVQALFETVDIKKDSTLAFSLLAVTFVSVSCSASWSKIQRSFSGISLTG